MGTDKLNNLKFYINGHVVAECVEWEIEKTEDEILRECVATGLALDMLNKVVKTLFNETPKEKKKRMKEEQHEWLNKKNGKFHNRKY